jgi:hypothetical protein
LLLIRRANGRRRNCSVGLAGDKQQRSAVGLQVHVCGAVWHEVRDIGIALGVVGTVGAFLWAPLLWCAAVGFVVIAVAFAISGGRF